MTNKKFNITSILYILLVVLLISIVHFNSVRLASLPAISQYFNISHSPIQFTFISSAISYSLFTLIFGPLSDHYGRRHLALLGIVIYGIGSLCGMVANNYTVLLLGGFIQGIGMGAIGAIAPAIPRDIFKQQHLVRAYSVYYVIKTTIPIITPLIGGYLQQYFGWRANFTFLTVYSAIILIIAYFYLSETNNQEKQVDKFSLKWFFKSYYTILINPQAMTFFLLITLVYSGRNAYYVMAPYLFQNNLGYTPVTYSYLNAIIIASFIIGNFVTAIIGSKLSLKFIQGLGLGLIFLGALSMFISVFAHVFNVYVIMFPMIIYMLGAGIFSPVCLTSLMLIYSDRSGQMVSVLHSMKMLITSIISSLVIIAEDVTHKPLAILIVMVSFISLMLFRTVVLKKKPIEVASKS